MRISGRIELVVKQSGPAMGTPFASPGPGGRGEHIILPLAGLCEKYAQLSHLNEHEQGPSFTPSPATKPTRGFGYRRSGSKIKKALKKK